jgi:hypothetical protein
MTGVDPSKRELILAKIKELLEAITGVEEVTIDKTTLVSISDVPMASIFIYAGLEARATDDKQIMGYETWKWTVIIELWSYIEDNEAFLKLIHNVININYTLDDLVSTIKRVGADPRYFDLDGTRKAMLIPFEVIYRHKMGIM